MERLEWEALPTDELVAELDYVGLHLPPGLVEEIVRRGSEAVALLGSVVADQKRWESDDDCRWAPLYALHLLGAIGDARAVPFILQALRLSPEPDEIIENTPTVIGHLGPEVFDAVAQFIQDETVDGVMRAVACDGLASLALLYPDQRPAVTAFLRRFVEEAEQHDPEAVTGAVLSLVELRDRDSHRAILNAFHAGRVDQDYLTVEDVREAFTQPDRISADWHYTGDPMGFFREESLERLRKREQQYRGF